jgi:diaminopimelate epimerase
MQGAGNDYIYIDSDKYPIAEPENKSIEWSAPHFGIGSDGLVLISKSDIADFKMRIFNADGSEAMMCGNASRCIGKYLFEYGYTDKKIIALETLSGIKSLKLNVIEDKVDTVTVDMGEPSDELVDYNCKGKTKMIMQMLPDERTAFIGTAVSMGNPHFVTFIDDVEHFDVAGNGSIIERLPCFSNRINVEFAEIRGNNEIRMRVWERGSGITMACGTGACATAVAAVKANKVGRSSKIIMDGGTLDIEWDEKTNHVFMTGEATIVFEGTINIEE